MSSTTIKLENPDFDTKIEVSLVEKAILDHEKCSSSRLVSWTAKQIGEQRGFVSRIVQLNLEWTNNPTVWAQNGLKWAQKTKLPKSVVLKIPTLDTLNAVIDSVKTDMENMDGKPPAGSKNEDFSIGEDFVLQAQRAECGFYDYAKEQQWQLNIPICYWTGVKNPAILIFEDLTDSSFKTVDDGLTLKQSLQVVDMLAQIHAHSIKHPEFKDSPHFDGPDIFLANLDKIIPGLPFLAEMGKKKRPDIFDPLADRMSELAKSQEDLLYITKMNELFDLPPVLVHGDMHIQNLAFEMNNSETLRSVYDWQMVHSGCVVEDIARLLCLSADADLRRGQLETILTHYHRSLGQRLSPMKTPFSYDTLRKAYDKVFRYATAMCIGGLIVIGTMPQALGENAEAKSEKLLNRAKYLLEDCLELMDAGSTR